VERIRETTDTEIGTFEIELISSQRHHSQPHPDGSGDDADDSAESHAGASDLVIIDEAHELSADEYRMLIARMTSEKVWQARVERMARELGWTFYHTYDSRRSQAGYPDLHLVRGGEEIYIECKTEAGELSAKQIEWRDLLVGAGAEWYCWRPSSIEFVEERLSRPFVPARGAHACDFGCQCKRVVARSRTTTRTRSTTSRSTARDRRTSSGGCATSRPPSKRTTSKRRARTRQRPHE
jgi:hypothetical protein